MSTAEIVSYRQAIYRGMRDAIRGDERVLLLGEDIAAAGGAFKVTEGLLEEFGPDRITDTPISETGFIGAAIGLALAGFRPIAELMFADFAGVAFDQIVNEAAKNLFLTAGQMPVPLVIRTAGGAGLRFGAQHSQTTESWYPVAPGLKVVLPSTPQDAYGLMLSAVQDDNPVVYIEHKALYAKEGALEAASGPIPIGKAAIARRGRELTIVASLAMVSRSLEAADLLAREGMEVEVIDPRTLVPLDLESIVESVGRTNRLVTVEEQTLAGGWGGHVVAEVVAHAFDLLDSPPLRIGLPDAPVGFSPVLEDAAIPSVDRICACARAVMNGERYG